ncbi:hypothetical protein HZS_3772 [Henneguya salminicola]|nr:hypothetical protein HZS_3772 [Henneguya salminicola]
MKASYYMMVQKIMENDLFGRSNIYLDSTCKSVPEIFYQLFDIPGKYNNVLITCVFALITRKTEIMCRRV